MRWRGAGWLVEPFNDLMHLVSNSPNPSAIAALVAAASAPREPAREPKSEPVQPSSSLLSLLGPVRPEASGMSAAAFSRLMPLLTHCLCRNYNAQQQQIERLESEYAVNMQLVCNELGAFRPCASVVWP